MFEEDGFVYKRLSIGKRPFESPGKKQQHRKTKNDAPFFSFKFVNKKESGQFALSRKTGDGESIFGGARPGTRKPAENRAGEKGTRGTGGNQAAYKPMQLSKSNESQGGQCRADTLIKNVRFGTQATVRDPLRLHVLLSPGDTLDSLTALAVDFLKKRVQNPPEFLDLLKAKVEIPSSNLKEDMDRLNMDIADMDLEMKKWEEVSCAVRRANLVSMDFSFQDYRVDEAKARTERIRAMRDAFREKENKLIHGLKGLERVANSVQMHCEGIFKKIFRLVEKSKGYDSFVLLKAISSLGKPENSVQT